MLHGAEMVSVTVDYAVPRAPVADVGSWAAHHAWQAGLPGAGLH
mgnify:CR=1 FL=1